MKLLEQQQKQLKKQLAERKKELEKLLAHSGDHGLNESMGESLEELSLYDNHPGDIGTELFERSKDFALTENAEHNLEEVIRALENIETGTYGVCLTCGQAIPYERLEAIPWTSYCIKHSPDQDVSLKRPVEEQFLAPPFGRTSLDERDDQTQFDGEDAWQIVESWGNSNSPALAENPDSFDYEHPYLEADENVGYVESLESFLATDLYGNARMVIRNDEYRKYMDSGEGDHGLEVVTVKKRRR